MLYCRARYKAKFAPFREQTKLWNTDGIRSEIFVLFYEGPTELSRRFRSERVESPTGIRSVNSPRNQSRKFPKVFSSFYAQRLFYSLM